MGQRRKEREHHWRGLLKEQAESGLSVARFCRQESVSAASFYAWRRKLKERDVTARQLVPVRIEPRETPASVRIYLPQGVAVDAPTTIDPSALANLLSVLREADRC